MAVEVANDHTGTVIGNSDMRYQSRIKKHWMSSLYVHFRA